MRFSLTRTFAIARKEVMHIQRDPQLLGFAMGMPVLLLLILGYAVSFDIEQIPLVVVDQSNSRASREVAREFTGGEVFDEVAHTDDPSDVQHYFRNGVANAALVIPHDFARERARGEDVEIQLLLDGADNNTAMVALSYANSLATQMTRRQLTSATNAPAIPIRMTSRTLFNPALRSSVFLVPGLIVLILVIIAVMLTALTVAREYEEGSMEQLFTTPVARLEIILGKLAPYFVLGQVQVLLVITAGVTLFGVPVRGSLFSIFVVASIFLLAMLMQGLLISVATRRQMFASQMALITTLLPSLLLSGFIFPLETMPAPVRVLAYVFPAVYFLDALRDLLLRGASFGQIWFDCVPMILFFVVALVIAAARFKRTLD
jgi:ABC-2 type transport system permease protein